MNFALWLPQLPEAKLLFIIDYSNVEIIFKIQNVVSSYVPGVQLAYQALCHMLKPGFLLFISNGDDAEWIFPNYDLVHNP